MQEFVVDANVLISVLISGKASYKLILSFLDLFTPDFALEEIEKYNSVIFERSKLNRDELRHFTLHIFNELTVVPSFVISDEALAKATELAQDIDIKDVSYIALAIQLDLILLTRDKKLMQGLKRKGFRKIMLFEDLLSSF
ncbi:MAG TPA: PIN domain-containing protein [Puia sp.]|nr:PIN domain-containing protein [Puia sp.]